MVDKIKDMKVEKKLKTCFMLVVVLSSIAGILGLLILLYTNSTYSKALVNNGFSQGEIGIFSTYLSKEPTIIREMILVQSTEELESANAELEERKQMTNEAYEVAKKHCTTAAEMEYINQIDEILPQYRDIFERVKELAMKNQNSNALELLLTEGKPIFQQLTDAVEGLIDLNVDTGNNVSRTLSIQTYVMCLIMLLVILAAVFISLIISKTVAQLFAEPIVKVKEAAAELAAGHLDVHVERTSADEIGDMTESFNEAAQWQKQCIKELNRILDEVAAGNFSVTTDMEFRGDFQALEDAIEMITDSLSKTLGNIYDASGQVSLGAGQMAESAQSLAEGATDQAASVEELTATIQNITETVVHSSEKANESYRNAEEFKRNAEESNESIKHLNEAMERINATSNEIANIIAAIEDIASQTNLLSLNASIEAARAGEAGKGFAVVADQIGKLASDSANSAIDTKKLIENSLYEIERGNEITAKATAAIEGVIQGIGTLAASTNEISEMSHTQAEAMKQLEEGIEQISEVIQNNSAAAQQTSATSQELSAQSEGLEQLVGQFTLKK